MKRVRGQNRQPVLQIGSSFDQKISCRVRSPSRQRRGQEKGLLKRTLTLLTSCECKDTRDLHTTVFTYYS
jgi:hypothetical protein